MDNSSLIQALNFITPLSSKIEERLNECLIEEHFPKKHLLVREGHLLARKDVAIPFSSVDGFDDGIRLSITRQQVRDLPPAGDDPAAA